jgi:hypothetical protein
VGTGVAEGVDVDGSLSVSVARASTARGFTHEAVCHALAGAAGIAGVRLAASLMDLLLGLVLTPGCRPPRWHSMAAL